MKQFQPPPLEEYKTSWDSWAGRKVQWDSQQRLKDKVSKRDDLIRQENAEKNSGIYTGRKADNVK